MKNDPGDGPDDENPNPFKGTPFEQIFNAFGAGGAVGAGFPGMTGAGGMPDLSALMSQMQAMMAPHEGSVNWALAKDVARRTVAENPDPTPTEKQQSDVADALRLADHWLDSATQFAPGGSGPAARSRAGGRGRVGGADDGRLEGAGRAGRRARRVRDGQRPARGGAAAGRSPDGPAGPGRRRDVRQPGRAGARRGRRRGAEGLRRGSPSRPAWTRRAAAGQRRHVRGRPGR